MLLAALVLIVAVWRDGVHVLHIGDWPAPFGITLVADLFSALMVMLAGVIGLLVTLYSLVSVDVRRASFGYYPLLLVPSSSATTCASAVCAPVPRPVVPVKSCA